MYLTKSAKLERIQCILTVAMMALICVLRVLNVGFAGGVDNQAAANTMVELVLRIVRIILNLVGIFFLIVGIAKFAMANSQDQGPEKRQAMLQIATGVAVVIIANVLYAMKDTFVSLVDTGVQ